MDGISGSDIDIVDSGVCNLRCLYGDFLVRGHCNQRHSFEIQNDKRRLKPGGQEIMYGLPSVRTPEYPNEFLFFIFLEDHSFKGLDAVLHSCKSYSKPGNRVNCSAIERLDLVIP